MDIILSVFLPLALAIIMFSLGLGLTLADFARVAREPKAFALGAVAQLLLLPLIAYLTVIGFGISGELAVGLMILSFCPGGVTSNILTRFAKGDLALSISLTGVISLVSVITVPVLVGLTAGHFLGVDAPPVDVTALGVAMFAITAVPVAIGMLVRRFAARLADAVETPVSHLATALFCIVVAGALASNWTVFVANLPVLGPAVVALNVVMLAIGIALARSGGLDRGRSSAIAIETGIQNATLGITVGSLISEQATGLPPFSLPSGVYGITMYLVSVPFVLWRRRLAPA